jgi:hypothetical protein
MLTLNLQNVEELIFYDKKAQSLLPEFKHLFDSWSLAKRYPALRNLGRRSISDLLKHLTETHVQLLAKYFGDEVSVDDLDYHIVKNYNFNINAVDLQDSFPNLVLYRRGDQLYISTWR